VQEDDAKRLQRGCK
jgi:hypothetical protein